MRRSSIAAALAWLRARRAMLALGALILLAGAACGGSDNSSPITAATRGSVVPSPSPASTPVRTAVATAPAEPVTAITIIARDNYFEPDAFRVPAGQEVTLTLRNAGAALHDWQVLNARDDSGAPIKTDLLGASQSATIRFTITAPGEFAFYCEVHPVEMRGRLAVQ